MNITKFLLLLACALFLRMVNRNCVMTILHWDTVVDFVEHDIEDFYVILGID